nr:MAG TPA: hypothetical protein [Caudoviricetes sp.]
MQGEKDSLQQKGLYYEYTCYILKNKGEQMLSFIFLLRMK